MRVEVNSGLNKIVREQRSRKNQIWNLKTQSLNVCVSYTTVEWCFTYHSHFETLHTHASHKLAPQNLRSCFTHRARSSHFTLHVSYPHFKTVQFILKVCVSHFKIAYYTSKLRLTLHTRISHLKLMVFHFRVLHFGQSLSRFILYMLLSRRWQYFSVLMTIWQQRGGRRWWPLSILCFHYVFPT